MISEHLKLLPKPLFFGSLNLKTKLDIFRTHFGRPKFFVFRLPKTCSETLDSSLGFNQSKTLDFGLHFKWSENNDKNWDLRSDLLSTKCPSLGFVFIFPERYIETPSFYKIFKPPKNLYFPV